MALQHSTPDGVLPKKMRDRMNLYRGRRIRIYHQFVIIVGLIVVAMTASIASGGQQIAPVRFPEELIERQSISYRNEHYVAASVLFNRLQSTSPSNLLVDIRGDAEFGAFHIPGSINMPLFTIKTKPSLKHKQVVLIGDGQSYAKLEQACQNLNAIGFQTSILLGGIYFWALEGLTIEGSPPSLMQQGMVPPQTFFSERHYRNWSVVQTFQASEKEAQALIPDSTSIVYGHRNHVFKAQFKREIEKIKHNPMQWILLVDRNGSSYDDIAKEIEPADTLRVFYLEGGIEGYRQFLEKQSLMWRPQDQRKISEAKCDCCPVKN